MPENDLMRNDILVFGYTGAYCDPVTAGYSLGNGYRVYLPELMRFAAPDDWSPFGKGGMNPYLYCGDDPINRSDPSGHLDVFGWLGVIGGIAGIAVAVSPFALAAIASIGTEIAMGTVVATAMQEAGAPGILSFFFAMGAEGAGVASSGFEDSHKTLSHVLAQVSAGLGGLSLVSGAAGSIRYLRRTILASERAAQTQNDLRATERVLQEQLDRANERLHESQRQLQLLSRNTGEHFDYENRDIRRASVHSERSNPAGRAVANPQDSTAQIPDPAAQDSGRNVTVTVFPREARRTPPSNSTSVEVELDPLNRPNDPPGADNEERNTRL